MTPEVAAYWDKTLRGLIRAIGPDGAKEVAMETQRRMGHGGTTRQWTAVLLRVLAEWARRNGYTGSLVDLVNATAEDVSAVGSAVAPTDPES